MSVLRWIAGVRALGVAVVGVGLAAVMTGAVVGTAADASAAPATPSVGSVAEAREVEIARIHVHFDSVLVELEARDVSALSATRRSARTSLMRTLRAYSARGVFPHNYDFPDRPTPYFVDRKTGTLCAVAFLLESTGHRDIVDRVARANNNVWVAELRDDAAFADWLDEHGLTLDEAARIQVPYVSPAEQTRQVTFMIAAPLSLVAATGTGVWNAWGNSDGHRRMGTVLGLTTGVLAAALSSTAMLQPDANTALRATAGAGVAIGTVGAVLSSRAMMRRGRYLAAKRDAERANQPRRAAPNASIAPIVPIGRQAGTGFAVSVRF